GGGGWCRKSCSSRKGPRPKRGEARPGWRRALPGTGRGGRGCGKGRAGPWGIKVKKPGAVAGEGLERLASGLLVDAGASRVHENLPRSWVATQRNLRPYNEAAGGANADLVVSRAEPALIFGDYEWGVHGGIPNQE